MNNQMDIRRDALRTEAMEPVHAGIVHTLAGNILYAASQWLISIFIVKVGGATLLGTYAISMAVLTPILSIGNMNLRPILVTDASRSVSFEHYFGLRLLSCGICLIIALTALAFFPDLSWASWLFGASIALYKVSESVPDIIQGIFQRAGQMRLVATSLFFRAMVVVSIFTVVSLGLRQVTLSFLALTIASLLITYFFDLRQAAAWERPRPRLGTPALKLAWIALPLAAGALISSVHLSIPRYFLNQAGKIALGQFAALTNLMIIGSLLASAIGMNWSPRMAKHFLMHKHRRFLKFAITLFLADIGIGAFAYVLTHYYGQQMLLLAYNTEIAAAHPYLPLFVIMLTLLLADSHIGVTLTAMRIFRGQIILQIVKVSVCAILCLTVYKQRPSISSAASVLNWSLLGGLIVGILLAAYHLIQRRVKGGSGAIPDQVLPVGTDLPWKTRAL